MVAVGLALECIGIDVLQVHVVREYELLEAGHAGERLGSHHCQVGQVAERQVLQRRQKRKRVDEHVLDGVVVEGEDLEHVRVGERVRRHLLEQVSVQAQLVEEARRVQAVRRQTGQARVAQVEHLKIVKIQQTFYLRPFSLLRRALKP